MLTGKDLNQFLEMIITSICDRLQVNAGFVAVLEGGKIDRVIQTGSKKSLSSLNLDDNLLQEIDSSKQGDEIFQAWET